jgi:CRISPR-associated protein Csd1
MLERNMMNHLAKIRKTESYGKQKKITGQALANILDWQIGQIKEGMTQTFYPKSLPLQEQGRFAIGYYHQRYTRKAKTVEGADIEYSAADDLNQNAEEQA